MQSMQEKFKEYFSVDPLKYPFNSNNSDGYIDALTKKLKCFEDLVRDFPSELILNKRILKCLPKIEKLSLKIPRIIERYITNNPTSASKELFDLLESQDFIEEVKQMTVPIDHSASIFYRMRHSNEPLKDRKEIFHIPYSKRHLVSKQRYSIAGLPCLYLGSSLYSCWIELNKPDLRNTYVSVFRAKKQKSQNFDMAFDLETIVNLKSKNEITDDEFLSKLTMWPMVMACSFQTKFQNAPFKEEYIIPSLLLEWINYNNSDISSLSYLSTKNVFKNDFRLAINYVLPPKNFKQDLCGKLISKFELTNPTSWELLNIIPQDDYYLLGDVSFDNIEEQIFNDYNKSTFGINQRKIGLMNFKPIYL